jgi:hypothetical protein
VQGFAAWWARLTLAFLAVTLAAPLNLNPLGTPFMLIQLANWILVLLLALGFAALRNHQGNVSEKSAGLSDALPAAP